MAVDPADLEIFGKTIATGLAEWDGMASGLEKSWPDIAARLRAFNGLAPWGDGPEGKAFEAQYLKDDGPDRYIAKGNKLASEIAKYGPTLRKAIKRSLETDAAIEAAIRSATRREV